MPLFYLCHMTKNLQDETGYSLMLFLQKQHLISGNVGCGKMSSRVGAISEKQSWHLTVPGLSLKLHILNQRLPESTAFNFSGAFHQAGEVISDDLLGNCLFSGAYNQVGGF